MRLTRGWITVVRSRGPRERSNGLRPLPHHPGPFTSPLAFPERAEVDLLQGHVDLRRDHLHQVTVDLGEGGAQDSAAPDELPQGALHGLRIVLARHHDQIDDVVGGAARDQLVQEPELLLGERGGTGPALPAWPDPLDLLGSALRSGHQGGEPGHGRALEQRVWRQVDAELVANARHGLEGQQGVPSEIEEVVMDPDGPHVQQLGEDGRDRLFRCIAGGDCFPSRRGARGGRDGKRPAVDLSVLGEREGLQEDELGRRHVLGQPGPQEGLKIPDCRRRSRPGTT